MEAVNAIGVQNTAALIEAAEPRWSKDEKSAASATSLHVRLRNRYAICFFFILFPTTASLTQAVWTLFWAIRPNTLHFCTGMHHHADWMQLKRAFSKGPSFPVAQLLYHCVLSTLSDQNEIFCPWFWNSYCFPAPFFEPSGESNVNVGWSWWSIWNAGEAQQTLEIGGIWHLGLIYHEITFSHQVKCPRGWSKDARCDDMVWRQNWATITFQKRSEYIGMIKGKVVSLFLKASLCLFLNSTMEPNCPGFLPETLKTAYLWVCWVLQ